MHFHGHGSSGQASVLTSPSIPPAPETTSAELVPLDPSVVRLRREDGRLEMHRDAWPPAGEDEAAAAPPADAEEAAQESPEPAAPEGQAEGPAQTEAEAADSGDETAADAGEAPESPEDAEWRPVILVRLFPLSHPDGWISVLSAEGDEVGVLLDLRALPEEDQQLAREELDRRYLVPEIRAILACRDRYDLIEWTVDTDRGRVTFLTRDIRESAK